MKKLIQRIYNAPITSSAGAIVGLPEIIAGIQTQNWPQVIKGLGLLLIGIAAADFKPRA